MRGVAHRGFARKLVPPLPIRLTLLTELKITMLRIKIKYLKIRMAIAINIPAIAGFLELFVLFERIIK